MYSYLLYQGYKLRKKIESCILGRSEKSYFRVWNLGFLDRSQWLSEEEIKALQLEGLTKLVEHAKRNTKYYTGLPNIDSLEDLEKIPILTKRAIKNNFDRLKAADVPGFKVTTSGTVSRSTTIKDKRLKFYFGEKRLAGNEIRSNKGYFQIARRGDGHTGQDHIHLAVF